MSGASHKAKRSRDVSEADTNPATTRPVYRGHRRNGLPGVAAASARERRRGRQLPHHGCDRSPVLPARCAPCPPSRVGRRASLALAHCRAGVDLPALSGTCTWGSCTVSPPADAPALDWSDPAVRPTLDSPIVYCLYLHRPRQRAGCLVRRDRVQLARDGADPIAGWASAERAWRLLDQE